MANVRRSHGARRLARARHLARQAHPLMYEYQCGPEGADPAEASEMLDRILADLRHEWERTRNPVYVWSAYRQARRNAGPIPEWVAAYLDATARRLVRLTFDPPREWRGAASKALALPRAPFNLARDTRDYVLGREADGVDVLTHERGIDVVAQRLGISRSEAYRARDRYRRG